MTHSSTDGVLKTIDTALHDWETSDDAMRWTPDPPSRPEPPLGHRLVFVRNPGNPTAPTVAELEAASNVLVHVHVDTTSFVQAMEGMRTAMQRLGEVIHRVTPVIAADLRRLEDKLAGGRTVYDDHHPRPLSVDGHAYDRRRRARRRRKR